MNYCLVKKKKKKEEKRNRCVRKYETKRKNHHNTRSNQLEGSDKKYTKLDVCQLQRCVVVNVGFTTSSIFCDRGSMGPSLYLSSVDLVLRVVEIS